MPPRSLTGRIVAAFVVMALAAWLAIGATMFVILRGLDEQATTSALADISQTFLVRFSNGLKKLGVGKETPVAIYMGMVPELPIAMLACTRLGAPHTVVFGGFSADSLSGRMNDMECEVLITQDEAWRRGKPVALKVTADEAMAADRKSVV